MYKILIHRQWGLSLVVSTLLFLNYLPSKAQFTQNNIGQNSFQFEVNIESLRHQFIEAPMEFKASKTESILQIELPNPIGDLKPYNVVESPIMEESGQELYGYKSYKAVDPQTGEVIGRFSVSDNGLTGIFDGENGLFSIGQNENGKHISFYEGKPDEIASCSNVEEKNHNHSTPAVSKSNFSVGRDLKTFKIAVTCVGEYGGRAKQLFQSPQILLADQINQVNFIFEKELSIKLQVVTPIKIHTSGASDPFTNFSTLNLISKGRTVIDSLYAGEDYQLGHLITLHGGGRAYIASVCRTLKSGAVSGMSIPASSNNIRLYAHEIGHQFGAGHSFSGRGRYCGSNVFQSSAYEIGSGSTIMSYAGSCHPDNVTRQRSAFFNAGAQQQIFDLINSKTVCWTSVQTGKTPPVVSTSDLKYIPARTPFILKGQASNPGGGTLSYSWEQSDLTSSAETEIPLAINRTAPIVRVYDPTSSPNRMIPALDFLLNNDNQAQFEVLPEISRDLNFRLVVRNSFGGSASKNQLVKVHDTGQAFKVMSFNTAETVVGGTIKNIIWNVANTNLFPITTSTVNIKMSIDGGNTFDINLASNVPNDGSQTITIPNQIATDARIMIEASNNIFFDINNAPITITNGQPAPCEISDLRLTNKSNCFDNGTANTSDDYFTANVEVYFQNKPPSGNLQLSGASAAAQSVLTIGDNSYTFSNIRIPADGRPLSLAAYFTNQVDCRIDRTFGFAPSPCSQPTPVSDLRLTMSSNILEYKKNERITIDLTLLNLGNIEEKNIVIKIPLPFGKLAYSSSAASHGSYNLFANEWVIPSLPINHSGNLKLHLFPLIEGEILTLTSEVVGNGISKSITIRPAAATQLPDLYLSDFSNSSLVSIGQLYDSKLKIYNSGNTPIDQQFRIGAYFSSDQVFDPTDPIIGEGIVTYVPIGDTQLNISFYLPNNALPGNYYLIYKVDKNNQIVESDENNNFITVPIQILGGAPTLKTDLELSSWASTTTLSDGTTTINVSVKNNGVGEASGVVIKHYPNAKFSTYLPGSFMMPKGVFDQNTKEWKINSIPAGTTYTLRFQERIIGLNHLDSDFIQVTQCNEDDVDSTPNNGNTFHKNPVEDDETSISFTPIVPASSDLKLTVASARSELKPNENGRVTFYLRNDGPDATTAKVKINFNQFTYESSSESLGEFSIWDKTWTVNNINSGQTAFLILDVYASSILTNTDISIFGEVIESANNDPDSTPDNGQCCAGREDDEAGKTIRIVQDQCSFNSIISNKVCDDNGTPSNPNDDTYHFSLLVKNGTSTGEWEGIIAGIYRRVSYGQTIFVGPLNIQNGQLDFEVMDTDNPNCKTSILVAPPAACSNVIAPTDYCEVGSIYPWYEWIAGVQINSFSNLSGKSRYTDYPDKPIQMTTGNINPIRLTGGYSWYSYDEYWRTWIDFNKNGEFESSEIVFQGINKQGMDGIPIKSISGAIYIGNHIQLGLTRMRIAVGRNEYPSACGDFSYGEVEDYPIEFIPNINDSRKENSFDHSFPNAEVLIYPNPTKGEINISADFEIEKFQIIDATGRIVKEEKASIDKVDLLEFPNGLYWISIHSSDSDEVFTKRFVIQR